MNVTLAVIAGSPLSGKTMLGRRLQKITGIHYCDSDDLRAVAFGVPTHKEYKERWENPEQATILIRQDMMLAYRLLHEAVNLSLEAQRSIIISATYSRKPSQKFLKEIAETHKVRLRFVVCRIQNETREEIERRMQRNDNDKFVYGLRTWEDYQTKRPEYEWPNETGIFSPSEVLLVDTGQALECYQDLAADFIFS